MSKFTNHARLLVLGLALLPPAQAVVIRGGATAEEDRALEARSHQAGVRLTSMVGITVPCAESPLPALGTGVYLGTSADGRRGLVLTAAHLFADLGEGAGLAVGTVVHVGPALDPFAAGVSTQLQVTRVRVHPRFKFHQDFTSRDAEGRPRPTVMNTCDLALLEFDAAAYGAILLKAGVTAAALYDGTGFTKPLLEAEVAGFGAFGTRTSPTVHNAFKVHAGNTRVSHGTWRGRTGFLHLSPLSASGLAALSSADPRANVYQFEWVGTPLRAFSPADRSPLRVQSHPNQALPASGDSGGPLFFNTKTGLKVAGIYSQYLAEPLLMDGLVDACKPFVLQVWEPVMEHLPWIQEVRGGAAAPAAPVEKKGETKVDAGKPAPAPPAAS